MIFMAKALDIKVSVSFQASKAFTLGAAYSEGRLMEQHINKHPVQTQHL